MFDSQLTFSYPLWLLVLPLPVAVYWLIPAYKTRKTAVKVPFFDTLISVLGETPSQGASQLKPSWWQRMALAFSWLCIVLALTKPMVLGEPQTRERYGRDVMVILDLSGSMAEPDFEDSSGKMITRLAAAKQVLSEFASKREGDRLGLILFGDAAFVQTPFTADLAAWQALLDQTDVAMAGQSTHLGDAIGLAIKVFEQSYSDDPEREKVAIVLTDGNDTGSFVEPIDAGKVAAVKGVRIHAIAMGDPATVGEQALDMDTLRKAADATGGETFEALNREALEQAYQKVGELEPQQYQSTTFQSKRSLHHYFMIAAVLLYLTVLLLITLRRRYQRRHAVDADHQQNQEAGHV
ncbi:vWA domain-containing protein [Photobacterium alginatilyticum]|uniref:vWA domain-containing protein n=1 Tax=Photobacterium alginatilyticum TaxID=1775171 RepID=UPI0040676C98